MSKLITVAIAFIVTVSMTIDNLRAEPKPPEIVFGNRVRVSSSEIDFMFWKTKYRLINLFDDDPRTAWVDGLRKLPTTIYINIPAEFEVHEMEIINGYAKTKKLYYGNNRISSIIIENGLNEYKYSLNVNKMEPQRITFERPLKGKITLKISTIVKGKIYDDTCISELKIFNQGKMNIFDKSVYISSTGGEYPRFTLVKRGKKKADFSSDNVLFADFRRKGKFLILINSHIGGDLPPGVTTINLETFRSKITTNKNWIDYNIRVENEKVYGKVIKGKNEVKSSMNLVLP